MLKFFLADYAGVFLLILGCIATLLIFKNQSIYGGLAWLVFFLYVAGVVIFGTTHR